MRCPAACGSACAFADLTLVALGPAPQTLALDGRAEAEVRFGLRRRSLRAALTRRSSTHRCPTACRDNAVVLGARYSIEELTRAARRARAVVRQRSGDALRRARGLLERKLKAPEVRLWPHHFDMDSLVPSRRQPRGRRRLLPRRRVLRRAVFLHLDLSGALHSSAAAAAAGRALAFVQVHRGAGARAQDRGVARPARRHRGLLRYFDRRGAAGAAVARLRRPSVTALAATPRSICCFESPSAAHRCRRP